MEKAYLIYDITYAYILKFRKYSKTIPEDIHQFDWRTFQQEYRDHIDLAKMAQLLPFVGAVVGYVVNYKLILKLADTAMNAYRMREEGLRTEDGGLRWKVGGRRSKVGRRLRLISICDLGYRFLISDFRFPFSASFFRIKNPEA